AAHRPTAISHLTLLSSLNQGIISLLPNKPHIARLQLHFFTFSFLSLSSFIPCLLRKRSTPYNNLHTPLRKKAESISNTLCCNSFLASPAFIILGSLIHFLFAFPIFCSQTVFLQFAGGGFR